MKKSVKMEIVAEFGCNWNIPKQAIEMLEKCGVLGIKYAKFQMWKKLQVPEEVRDMYIDEYLAIGLMAQGAANGVEVFFTPFYPEAVDILEKIKIPYYKIRYADYYTYDRSIMNKVLDTGKMFFISCLTPFPHIRAVSLECAPVYPAPRSGYQLIHEGFEGISDHTRNLKLYKECLKIPRLKFFEMHVCLDKTCYEAKWSKTFDEIEEVIS